MRRGWTGVVCRGMNERTKVEQRRRSARGSAKTSGRRTGHPRSSLSTFIPTSLQPPRFSPARRRENSITMALQRSSVSWLSSTLAVLAILCLSVPANALYFYMGEGQTKCFFEELPKDTLVVGAYHLPQPFWCFFM